jgi:hypothetical protein
MSFAEQFVNQRMLDDVAEFPGIFARITTCTPTTRLAWRVEQLQGWRLQDRV